jgi:hypothetical protein
MYSAIVIYFGEGDSGEKQMIKLSIKNISLGDNKLGDRLALSWASIDTSIDSSLIA